MAAEMLQEQHPDTVVLATFPDKFATEQETTISTALSLASDPDVKGNHLQPGRTGYCGSMPEDPRSPS